MYKLKNPQFHASEIAEFLNLKLKGADFTVQFPSSSKSFGDDSFFYLEEGEALPAARLREHQRVLILAPKNLPAGKERYSFIVSPNPLADFIKVINELFIEFDVSAIAASARIDPTARLGKNVSVGENSVVGPGVVIGANTRVLHNVVITGRVEIGAHCIIKNNTTIGGTGFDFIKDREGKPVNFPHIGRVVIGDRVWIGSNASVEIAALDDTAIGDDVKIDDLVQIGYNCAIGARSVVTAGVIVSRGVRVGENSWIAPNASIVDGVVIGDNVTVGAGAVVTKDLKGNGVYVGNPARFLRGKKKGE
jgi:UDP-3-O-[3-hydroxymyristoyl] glucosamine N-acyltransferase